MRELTVKFQRLGHRDTSVDGSPPELLLVSYGVLSERVNYLVCTIGRQLVNSLYRQLPQGCNLVLARLRSVLSSLAQEGCIQSHFWCPKEFFFTGY
jgi:hypothetical protein